MSNEGKNQRAPLVLYHANCVDGFTAAWAAWAGLTAHGQVPELRPVVYTDQPATAEEVAGRDVYIVDFSYSREVIESWADAARIVMLDHHKTMAEAWGFSADEASSARLSNAEIYYDPNRSGAGMAWGWFAADTRPPSLVEYVQDRDLWRFELPDSKAINAYISTQPHTLSDWDRLEDVLCDEHGRALAAGMGEAILRAYDVQVAQMAQHSSTGELCGVPVVLCNAPVLQSEVGAHLAGAHPDRVAVIWHHEPEEGDRIRYSFRSVGDVDASSLAKRFGGGGHKNASGAVAYGSIQRQVMPPDDAFTFDPIVFHSDLVEVGKAAAALSNVVYSVCAAVYEHLEHRGRVRGNGHHMAQKAAEFVSSLMCERWR